jgi:hypothetical protein
MMIPVRVGRPDAGIAKKALTPVALHSDVHRKRNATSVAWFRNGVTMLDEGSPFRGCLTRARRRPAACVTLNSLF